MKFKINLKFNLTAQSYSYEEVEQCANFIKSKIGDVKPKIAIICGSGLGGLTNSLKDTVKIPYTEIPNFGTSSGK